MCPITPIFQKTGNPKEIIFTKVKEINSKDEIENTLPKNTLFEDINRKISDIDKKKYFLFSIGEIARLNLSFSIKERKYFNLSINAFL